MKSSLRKSFKRNDAITLIALVVTIVVLIILAGVSINLLLGQNGLITKAKEAKENMELAQIEEQQLLNETSVYLDDLGTTIPTVPISSLEVGDYIKYNTAKEEIGDNGVVLCRVLYNDKTHGLQIITDKNITKKIDGVDTEIKVTLGEGSTWEEGKTAYNSAIETLNNEAEKYLNTKYVYDARCVGSLSTIGEDGTFDKKDNGITTTVILPLSAWSSYKRPNGWTSDDTGCYKLDTNYTDDETAMKGKINLWVTAEEYWLASRFTEEGSSFCSFNVRRVSADGSLGSNGLCYVNSSGNTVGSPKMFGFRPCFSLKSNIKVTGENGKTADTAYVIE